MHTSVKTSGEREWRLAIERKAHGADTAAREATVLAGQRVERRIKRRLLTFTHPPGTPTPSPPGMPPAYVSGDLYRSVRASTVTKHRRRYRVLVGPTNEYGRAQELGYEPRDLPPRPFVKPATREELNEIRRIYHERWLAAMQL